MVEGNGDDPSDRPSSAGGEPADPLDEPQAHHEPDEQASAPVVIALFPLTHVFLPGMPLPLHIFEQRYRDLVDDVENGTFGRPWFGVVALRSGTEAAHPRLRDTGPDVEQVGTMADVVELERNTDGTSDLLAAGSRRFRIRRLVTEGTAYLRAEVDFLDETDGAVTDAIVERARNLIDVYDDALTRLAGRPTGSELVSDVTRLSFQIAARLPLTPADRQALLAEDDAASRLRRVAELTRRELALLRSTRSIAVSPSVLRIGAGVN